MELRDEIYFCDDVIIINNHRQQQDRRTHCIQMFCEALQNKCGKPGVIFDIVFKIF